MNKIDWTRISPTLAVLAASLILLGTAMALDLSGAAGITAGLLATLGVLLAAKAAAQPEKHDGLAMTFFGALVVAAPFMIAPFFSVPASAILVHVVCGGAILARARLGVFRVGR